MNFDVLVVGAGLSGLCCAQRLREHGLVPRVLEASDEVGGRVRTDNIDGFLLDRGFQVLLTAYPTARATLDYADLDLRPFKPGALIRWKGRFHRIADPWRSPIESLPSLFGPIGTLTDKLRVAALRRRVTRGPVEALFERPEDTTIASLRRAGLSRAMIEQFFRPFLGGVFLDPDLTTSSRVFEFVFRMFAQGDAALPAGGMQAIATQIAAGLPPGSLRCGAVVAALADGGVLLESGEIVRAGTVVIATEGSTAARLLGKPWERRWNATTCLYFAAERPPVDEPTLVLDGEGRGPVTNLCVPSLVAPTYAPAGAALVSANIPGDASTSEAALVATAREQLADWFGRQVERWTFLRSYRIAHALPDQSPPLAVDRAGAVCGEGNVYVCGDYLDTSSIEGAMRSGLRAADAVASEHSR